MCKLNAIIIIIFISLILWILISSNPIHLPILRNSNYAIDCTTSPSPKVMGSLFFFLDYVCMYVFLDGGGEWEKEKEKSICQLPLERPNQGPGPQPRHVRDMYPDQQEEAQPPELHQCERGVHSL